MARGGTRLNHLLFAYDRVLFGKAKSEEWKKLMDMLKVYERALATKKNLWKRKAVENASCPICGFEEETAMHVMWQCPAARDIWIGSIQVIQKWSSVEDNFLILWEKLIDKLTDKELELVAVLMRLLWLRRNSFIFEEKFKDPDSVIRSARAVIEDFQEARIDESKIKSPVTIGSGSQRWIKPTQGFIKANWDASLGTQNLGLGIVLRNGIGEVLACACYKKPPVSDSTLAETMALWQAVELSNELGFRVILEGDAQVMVQAINSEDEDFSLGGHIVEDVKVVLRERRAWKVQFTRREGNGVANSLAKKALLVEHD
ncbi:uncharacterized protein LOC122274411 [Carya illinoinensis]|uniref:uncharacterized protein LOC122274411 n=1 Tax=Carya illinoinensis TaxID=32201 RepID=UPI001C723F49|nr:uncharacterized protein LOC122274411 [Carya illinoinensis]